METVNLPAISTSLSTTTRESLRDDGVNKAILTPDVKEEGSRGLSRRALGDAVDEMKSFAQSIQRNLDFSVDDSTGQVVVKVIDGSSGDVIRQIPSEEILRLSERLADMRSLLFQAKA